MIRCVLVGVGVHGVSVCARDHRIARTSGSKRMPVNADTVINIVTIDRSVCRVWQRVSDVWDAADGMCHGSGGGIAKGF